MAYRILTQINFSAGENPEGDSGLYFISDLIKAILEIDETFHFYVLIPKKHKDLWETNLTHNRITLIPIDIVRRSHGGDFQFTPEQIMETFKFRSFEVDCLLLNQPELVIAYVNLFNKLLFHCIPAFSYVHWFDTRPVGSKINIEKPALLSALSGMISSDLVGCNSEFGKDRIIRESKRWFNDDNIDNLKSKIEIIPPGINTKEIDLYSRNGQYNNLTTIIINHRLLTYTGVRDLLTVTFPELWKIRRDFSVIVTNPSNVRLPLTIQQAPWLKIGNFSRDEYFTQLVKSDIVISPHKATHWSISTLEAMYSGCVPLMNHNSFFPELMSPIIENLESCQIDHIKRYWFFSNNEILKRICYLIDNIEYEKKLISQIKNNIKSTYDWPVIAKKWIQYFYDLEERTRTIPMTNPSLQRIINMINETGYKSKQEILKELAWGPQSSTLSWSAFRKRLNSLYIDDSNSSDVIYRSK